MSTSINKTSVMTSTNRRQWLALTASTVFTPVDAQIGTQTAWPTRPLRIVVPFPPGGATDIVGRFLAERLSARLSQAVLVEHKPGESTMTGVESVVKAPPDGYTLLVSGATSFSVQPAITPQTKYNPLRDLCLLGIVATTPLVLLTSTAKPYYQVADLVKAARERPRQLAYYTYGAGSAPHLSSELFAKATHIECMAIRQTIQYKGSADAMLALIRGEMDFGYDTVSASMAYIQTGKLRPLAVSSLKRSSFLEQIPSMGDLKLPEAEFEGYYAVAFPAGVPIDIVQRMSNEIETIMSAPETQRKFRDRCLEPVFMGTPAFENLVEADIQRYRNLVRRFQLKFE